MSTTTGAISLKGLDKADVLAALYNASRPQGLGFLHYDPEPMTRDQAQELLDSGYTDFDYLKGRVMKVNLSGDELRPYAYDRDNGAGAAETAISALRQTHDTNPDTIQGIHRMGRTAAAGAAIDMFSGGKEMSESDFVALGRQKERIEITDTIASMVDKMSEGNPGAMTVLMQLLNHSESGFMEILGLDTNRLYGHRIWDLFKLCGEDIERFSYHIAMELPNQATGQVSVTGPYCGKLGEEGLKAHFAARKYGKPGSFWAMENPPTDPNFAYPIIVGSVESSETVQQEVLVRVIDASELKTLAREIENMRNPRARRGLLDSMYARTIQGKTNFTGEAINGFRVLLCRYGFQNHATKLATVHAR